MMGVCASVDVETQPPRRVVWKNVPSLGAAIRDRWLLTKRLGEGGCGVVFEVVDKENPERRAALKLEPIRPKNQDEIIKMEVHVLRQLKHSAHACQLLACGTEPTYSFMVMSLVGPNLGDLRRATPEQRFTLPTACRLIKQCLRAVADLHEAGFVHRDIKPSNYALGREFGQQRTVFLLDFGLTRCFVQTNTVDGTRKARTPRRNAAFRGTLRYASLRVHSKKEQGRCDDVQSLLYMCVEMIRGELPWRSRSTKDTIECKSTTHDMQLYEHCPEEMIEMQSYIRQLSYDHKPDYNWIEQKFDKILADRSITDAHPFDWEENGRFYEHFLKRQHKKDNNDPKQKQTIVEPMDTTDDTDWTEIMTVDEQC